MSDNEYPMAEEVTGDELAEIEARLAEADTLGEQLEFPAEVTEFDARPNPHAEVRLVALQRIKPDELGDEASFAMPDSVNAIAVACDLTKDMGDPTQGRMLPVGEVGDDFDAYIIDGVCEDMDNLSYRLTMAYADAEKRDPVGSAQRFIQILADFQDKPVEVLGNMLAAILTDCIDVVLNAEDGGEAALVEYNEWLKARIEGRE